MDHITEETSYWERKKRLFRGSTHKVHIDTIRKLSYRQLVGGCTAAAAAAAWVVASVRTLPWMEGELM